MEGHQNVSHLGFREIRYTFQASSRMKQATQAFLNEKVSRVPIRFYSSMHVTAPEAVLQQHAETGSLFRIEQMAGNLESPLYPNGIVRQQLSQQALELTFELADGSLKRLTELTNRLDRLGGVEPKVEDDMNNGISVRIPKLLIAETALRELAVERFHTKIRSETEKHYYYFEPSGLEYPFASQGVRVAPTPER